MDRRAFLHGIVGTVAMAATACGDDSGEPGSSPSTSTSPTTSTTDTASALRPNVVVIYLDDMRFDGLAFMPQTLARFDHQFTEARANGGACTDTRMGLHTGTYILNHPWDIWDTATERDATRVWGSWLQAAGYRTALFGKYIGTDGWPFGAEQGWDVWRSYVAGAHLDEGFEIDLGTEPLDPVRPDGRNLDYLIEELIDFCTGTEGQPFFASWNPQHPHLNYDHWFNVQPEHVGAFADLPSPVPIDEDITGKPQWVQDLPPIDDEMRAALERAQQGQAQSLAGVDDAIEELFVALEADGILDDTIVFLSSDQGVHYGEHRWGAALGVTAGVQKGTMYEPVVRVPMLATGPGFPAGVSTFPVTQADITATAVAVAGARPSHDLDGIDLRPAVADPTPHTQRVLLLQSKVPFTPVPDHDSIVTGPDHARHPLRKFGRLATGEVELYDLNEDPGEFVNLADAPDRQEERAALEEMLADLLAG